MKKVISIISIFIVFAMTSSINVDAHSGRTDASGCHTETATGDYHCHSTSTGSTSNNSSTSTDTSSTSNSSSTSTVSNLSSSSSVENCSSAGSMTAELTIDVIGTTISVTGRDNIIGGESMDLNIVLADSSGAPIKGKNLKVESVNGFSTFDNSSPTTDVNGRATVKLTATNVTDTDIIRISTENPDHAKFAELEIAISNNTLQILAGSGVEFDMLPINQDVELIVKSNISGTVTLSTTRGEIPSSVTLRPPVTETGFTIRSNNVGPVIITASVESEDLSTQIEGEFVATQVESVIIQAEPAVIGVNLEGDSNRSEITATVRDPNKNLVKGKRVNFTVEDITGGRVSPPSAITDS